MKFLDTFMGYFKDEEKGSELVKIVASCGVNAESALIQEIRKEVLQAQDWSLKSEEQIRSILSFFLIKVRNVVSPIGVAKIHIDKATARTVIKKDSILMGEGGVTYLIQDDFFGSEGESKNIRIIQGELKSHTGTYDEFITIPAVGVDMSSLSVTLNDKAVPDVLDTENKSEYAIPQNGYYASYYSGILYIRIWKGEDVLDPTGMPYEVNYRTSEGYQGNLGRNKLTRFQTAVVDDNGSTVDYTLSNEPITNGVNSPTRTELLNLLRFWFFVKRSVSSIPEYVAWFLAQPEIGDVKVDSDYTKWKATGVLAITGQVTAILMDKLGNNLTQTAKNAVESRLVKVRDVGITKYEDFEKIEQKVVVSYISALDENLFKASTEKVIRNLYDIKFVTEKGDSLFNALELKSITDNVDWDLQPLAMDFKFYHYKEVPIKKGELDIKFESYDNEVAGSGVYKVVNNAGVELAGFTEKKDDGTGKVSVIDSAKKDVGLRGIDTNKLYGFIAYVVPEDGKLICLWKTDNQVLIPVGSVKGARAIKEVEFVKYK